MTERDQAELKAAVLQGSPVAWLSDDGTFHIVVSVTEVIDPTDGKKEPGLCAVMGDGKYVALYNAGPRDFFYLVRVFGGGE